METYELGVAEWHELKDVNDPDVYLLYHRTIREGAHYSLLSVKKISETEYNLRFRLSPLGMFPTLDAAKQAAEQMAIAQDEPYSRTMNLLANWRSR